MSKKIASFATPKPRRGGQSAHVDEAAASAFVDGALRKGTLRRAISGERITITLPPEVTRDLRVACASQRRSVSDAITEAVRGWLDGHALAR